MAKYTDWELDSLRKRLWISRGGHCVLTEEEREIASLIADAFDGDFGGDDDYDEDPPEQDSSELRRAALDMIKDMGLYDDLKGRIKPSKKPA